MTAKVFTLKLDAWPMPRFHIVLLELDEPMTGDCWPKRSAGRESINRNVAQRSSRQSPEFQNVGRPPR
jgi:hypothetical protein